MIITKKEEIKYFVGHYNLLYSFFISHHCNRKTHSQIWFPNDSHPVGFVLLFCIVSN